MANFLESCSFNRSYIRFFLLFMSGCAVLRLIHGDIAVVFQIYNIQTLNTNNDAYDVALASNAYNSGEILVHNNGNNSVVVGKSSVQRQQQQQPPKQQQQQQLQLSLKKVNYTNTTQISHSALNITSISVADSSSSSKSSNTAVVEQKAEKSSLKKTIETGPSYSNVTNTTNTSLGAFNITNISFAGNSSSTSSNSAEEQKAENSLLKTTTTSKATPTSKLRKTTARICLMIKNGEKYLKEWLDYNLALGFTDIQILDNSKEFSMSNWTYKKEKLHISHFVPEDRKKGVMRQQLRGYKTCVEQARRDGIGWLATLDVDEFLVLKRHQNVLEYMQEVCRPPCGQVRINWIIFGNDNRTRYVDAPVTQRFKYGNKTGTVKSIVDPWSVELGDKFDWSHSFITTPNSTWNDASGKRHRKRTGWKIMVNDGGPDNTAALHHYKYLSEEEWNLKTCKRGRVHGHSECGLKVYPWGKKYYDHAWEFLRSRVPEYQKYDHVQDLG